MLKPLACQAGLEILNRGGNASELDACPPHESATESCSQWMLLLLFLLL